MQAFFLSDIECGTEEHELRSVSPVMPAREEGGGVGGQLPPF